MKQRELSIWLRAIVILLGLAVAFASAVVVPGLGRLSVSQNPELAFMYWPCLLYVWVTVIPVAAALVILWLISAEIGRDNSFCAENARRLKAISILAVTDTAAYILSGFLLAPLNLLHPGLLIIISLIAFVGLAIAVAAAALSHLTQKAAALKAENDLTI